MLSIGAVLTSWLLDALGLSACGGDARVGGEFLDAGLNDVDFGNDLRRRSGPGERRGAGVQFSI
jgi:hypothetical protein